jgi:hypothetical protein
VDCFGPRILGVLCAAAGTAAAFGGPLVALVSEAGSRRFMGWPCPCPYPFSTFLCWEDTSSPHTVHTFINEILASVIPGGKMKCYIGLKQWYCRKGVSKMPLQICKAFFGYKTQRIPISQVPEESAGTVASVANAASG